MQNPQEDYMDIAKPLSTPLSMLVKLRKDECPKFDDDKEFVSNLCMPWQRQRHTFHFWLRAVSRSLSKFGKRHWKVVKIMPRYLRGLTNKCLCLGGRNVFITEYTDFDYASCSDNEKCTLGYFCSVWEMLYLGDLISKNVLLCLL